MESGATWRKPVFIEDSRSARRRKYGACNPEGDCVLLGFVPPEVEPALLNWLVKTIGKLEASETKH